MSFVSGNGNSGGYVVSPRVRLGWLREAWNLFYAQRRVWLGVSCFAVGVATALELLIGRILLQFLPSAFYRPTGRFLVDFKAETYLHDWWDGLFYLLVAAALAGAAHRMAVRQVRGEPIVFRDIFHFDKRSAVLLGYALIAGSLMAVGFFFWFVPGIILAALLLLVPARVAAGQPLLAAILRSLQVMGTRLGSALALTFLLCFLIALAVAPYLLGLIVLQPLLWLIGAIAARDLIEIPDQAVFVPDYGTAQENVWPPPPKMDPPH